MHPTGHWLLGDAVLPIPYKSSTNCTANYGITAPPKQIGEEELSFFIEHDE
jgi:hypothetical protein